MWQHWLRLRSRTATATDFHDCALLCCCCFSAARHATCRDFQIRCASEFVLTVVGQPEQRRRRRLSCEFVYVMLLSLSFSLCMRSPVGVCRSVRALVCACTVYVGVCVRLRYQRAGPGPASAQARLFAHSLLSLLLSCLIAKLYEYVLETTTLL